jgi:hypothetical protein
MFTQAIFQKILNPPTDHELCKPARKPSTFHLPIFHVLPPIKSHHSFITETPSTSKTRKKEKKKGVGGSRPTKIWYGFKKTENRARQKN